MKMSVIMGRMSWCEKETCAEEGKHAMREKGMHERHEKGQLSVGLSTVCGMHEMPNPVLEKKALPNSSMGSICWPNLATTMDKKRGP